MKLKKKAKIIIIAIFCIIVLGVGGYFIYNALANKTTVKETKVLSSIDEYDYHLKDTRNKEYQDMFKELEEILTGEIDEEAYVNQIAKMFIYDFYTLDDKVAKTDVGGVDFVYDPIINDFLTNAEDTYYKYLESDIYDDREQILPIVDTIEILATEQIEFEYLETTDPEAYKIDLSWAYTSSDFASYQSTATLIFIHNEHKLDLVELSINEEE